MNNLKLLMLVAFCISIAGCQFRIEHEIKPLVDFDQLIQKGETA